MTSQKFSVRKAQMSELDELLLIYEAARKFMKDNGNESQWGLPAPGKKLWPSEESVVEKINAGIQFVCETEIDGELKKAATFAYTIDKEPVYDSIFDGKWPDNSEPYGVIHAIASTHIAKGAAGFCFEWALEQFPVLRIDTHPDNKPMRSLLEKCGFTYCGKIIFDTVQNDDTLRIAFCKFKS